MDDPGPNLGIMHKGVKTDQIVSNKSNRFSVVLGIVLNFSEL